MNLARFAIRRPTLIVFTFLLILVVGMIGYSRLGVDLLPDASFPVVTITTVYRGAGPWEMEAMVSKPLEEQISSLSGMSHVTSINQDGVSVVTAEFRLGVNATVALQNVRDKVALVRPKLPRECNEPLIKLYDMADMPVIQLAFSGNLPSGELFDLVDQEIRPKIEQVPNVAVVELMGGTKREIQVCLDRNALRSHRTSLTSVSGKISSNSQNVPIGEVARDENNTTYRSLGEYRNLDQIRKVAVSFYGSENPVTVGNLGEVIDTTEEPRTLAYFDGRPAIIVNVFRQSGSNSAEVANTVIKLVGRINESLDQKKGAPRLTVSMNVSKYVGQLLDDAKQSIFEGLLLLLFVVYLVLGNGRSMFITGMAIPNSIIGTFLLMYLMGYTLNIMSLISLSLAVGLVIDDAIVVRENIWRHMEAGAGPKKAAIAGTNEVRLAVVATTLAVISIFMPVGFLTGPLGSYLQQLGMTIVFAMLVSLVDSMTMAPLLSAYMAKAVFSAKGGVRGLPPSAFSGKMDRFLTAVSRPPQLLAKKTMKGMDWVRDKYVEVMKYCLANPLRVLASCFGLFAMSILVLGPRIKSTLRPSFEMGIYKISLQASPAMSLEGMRSKAKEIEKILWAHKETAHVTLEVGNLQGEKNVANFLVELVSYKKRKMTTATMKEVVRKELARYPELSPRIGNYEVMRGSPFMMNLIGEDLDSLNKASVQLIEELRKVDGLVDISADFNLGKPEFQVVMDRDRARSLGVSTDVAGAELRGMVSGIPAAKYRDNGKEYDILVRLRDGQRDLQADYPSIFVPNMNQTLVRLADVSTHRLTSGPSRINRRDRVRYIQISGELGTNGALGNIRSDVEKILKKIKLPAGVKPEFVGQSEDYKGMMNDMVIAMGLGIFCMYIVLGSLYESIIVPFLIMLALPFSIIGALGALYITGQTLNIFSMIAIVLLMGIVAKNSILLIDYTVKHMRAGLSRDKAIILAGKHRIRPILMTTFALIAGMLPLALGFSEMAQLRSSMGICVIGGLISSTFLTLLVIPAAFGYVDRFRLWTRIKMGRPPERELDDPEV